MQLYKLHYDADNQQYWIGKTVIDSEGRALFVQQVGKYYQHATTALNKLHQLEEAQA